MMTERARPKLGLPGGLPAAAARARSKSGSIRPSPASPPSRMTSRRLRWLARNSAQPEAPEAGLGMVGAPAMRRREMGALESARLRRSRQLVRFGGVRLGHDPHPAFGHPLPAGEG